MKTSMEQWWSDTETLKQMCWEKTYQYHTVYYKCHKTWLGIDTGAQW